MQVYIFLPFLHKLIIIEDLSQMKISLELFLKM